MKIFSPSHFFIYFFLKAAWLLQPRIDEREPGRESLANTKLPAAHTHTEEAESCQPHWCM